MNETNLTSNEYEPVKKNSESTPRSLLDIILALFVLLVWGSAWIYAAVVDIFPANAGFITPFVGYLLAHAISLIGVGVGWWLNFPRWSYLYVGFALTFTWYWSGLGMNGLSIWGLDNVTSGRWSWRAWISVLILVVVMLLLTRSLQPVRQFFLGIWQDWSYFSLSLYGWLVFLLMIIHLDGIELPVEFWSPIWILIAFLGGVILYMIAGTPWKRVLGLDLGLFVGVGGMIVLGQIIQPDIQQFASFSAVAHPARFLYVLFMFGWVLVWLGLVFLPAILVLFKRTKKVAAVV